MNTKKVKEALMSVISEIQENSGLDCPSLTGTTIPAEQVPKFDSKVWIAATTMLAGKLDANIPQDQNIFYDKKKKSALTISQVVQLVCSVATYGGKSEDAA